MRERGKLLALVAVFVAAWAMPIDDPRFRAAVLESLAMLREYARDHVLTCLVPAFFVAGAIAVLLSQDSVLRYLGPRASKPIAYAVASVSGTVLAVCSCTVLPLFAGIYRRGAGLGPASAFLYSGPAINVLAIVLTGRVLGVELGVARAVGAVLFALLIGLAMGATFRAEERARGTPDGGFGAGGQAGSGDARAVVYLAVLVLLLVFAAWGRPADAGSWAAQVHAVKWYAAGAMLALAILLSMRWHDRDQRAAWFGETWSFVKLIAPLLFAGVLAAGLLLGRPGTDAGLVPRQWIEQSVGGNSLAANAVAALAGALMYVATLTEIPILQGLLGNGMGQGPALALLLAGPAVSLPSLLVIRGVLGTRKTLAYAAYVVLLSTLAGYAYGALVAG
ncbi:MAG: permease [Planctomycetes bacterium]|nr:permease [Planctomycetota bacterium]